MGAAPLQSVVVERKDTDEFSGCYDNKTSLHVLVRQTHIPGRTLLLRGCVSVVGLDRWLRRPLKNWSFSEKWSPGAHGPMKQFTKHPREEPWILDVPSWWPESKVKVVEFRLDLVTVVLPVHGSKISTALHTFLSRFLWLKCIGTELHGCLWFLTDSACSRDGRILMDLWVMDGAVAMWLVCRPSNEIVTGILLTMLLKMYGQAAITLNGLGYLKAQCPVLWLERSRE